MRKMMTALIATFVILATTWAEVIVTHTGADDAFLRENQPDSHQGDARNLFGGQSSGEQFVVLMKFALPPLEEGAIITSVKLDLGPAMTSGSGFTNFFMGHLFRYTDFDAATATWRKPTGSLATDTTPGGSYSAATLLSSEVFTTVDTEPDTQAFPSTLALVNYIRMAYENGDAEVYFRLSNDGESESSNSFIRTDAGTTTGTGHASLIFGFDPVPQAPAEWWVDPIMGLNGYVDEVYNGTLAGKAVDPNNDPITYSLIDGPSWLNVAPDGALSGMPTTNDMGTNTFTVAVTDGISGANEAILNIFVDMAIAPEWKVDPIIGVDGYVGVAYNDTLAGKATDANDDPITYSLVGSSTWLNVAANGALSGTPAFADEGMNTFIVAAHDGVDATEATLKIFIGAVLPVEVMNDGFEATTTLSGNGWDTSLNVSWTMSTMSFGNPRFYVYGAGELNGDDPAHEAGIISKDSGYVIQAGEELTLKFDVLDTAIAATNGVILAKLYYFDGLSNVELGSVEVVDPNDGGWKNQLGALTVNATIESIGHNLCVSFEGIGGDGLSAQRLGIDNVIITRLPILRDAVTVSILKPVPGSSEIELSWENQIGITYGVETNSDLLIGNWNSWRSGVNGAGETITIAAPVTEDKTFYRIITE